MNNIPCHCGHQKSAHENEGICIVCDALYAGTVLSLSSKVWHQYKADNLRYLEQQVDLKGVK